MEIIGYASLIAVGLLLGVLGGGGSVLSIPILVYLFSLDIVVASAYSLFIVGATSLVGAFLKQRDGLVDIEAGLKLGIPSLIATFSTRKWIVCSIPDVVIQAPHYILTRRMLMLVVFAGLVIISSFIILLRKPSVSEKEQKYKRPFIVVLAGLFIGFISGLAGIGGGFLILPALVLLVGQRFHVAVGTALFVIALNSLLGFAGDVINLSIDWIFLSTITAVAVTGVLVGSNLNQRISAARLKRAFGWVTIGMGIFILIKEF